MVEDILSVVDGPGVALNVPHENIGHNLLMGQVTQLLLWTGHTYSVHRNGAAMAAGSQSMAH